MGRIYISSPINVALFLSPSIFTCATWIGDEGGGTGCNISSYDCCPSTLDIWSEPRDVPLRLFEACRSGQCTKALWKQEILIKKVELAPGKMP